MGREGGNAHLQQACFGLALCQALCVQSISSYLLKQSTSWMINLRFRKTSKLPRGSYESNEPESQMSKAFASFRLPQSKSRDLRCWERFQPLRQTWPLQGATSRAPSLALRVEQGSERCREASAADQMRPPSVSCAPWLSSGLKQNFQKSLCLGLDFFFSFRLFVWDMVSLCIRPWLVWN